MKRVQGPADVALIECVNPRKDKWRIRWDVRTETDEDGNETTSYWEETFNHRPSQEEIRETVFNQINDEASQTITSGYTYNDLTVWLSKENQLNYLAMYSITRMPDDSFILPLQVKLGTDEEPVIYKFPDYEAYLEFYWGMIDHIQTTLCDAWKKKTDFDITLYNME